MRLLSSVLLKTVANERTAAQPKTPYMSNTPGMPIPAASWSG